MKSIKLKELSKNIVASAPLSIITIDKQGNIIFANKYFRQISVEKSPLGRNIFNMPFFVREGLCDNYGELFRTGVSFKRENCVSMDGSKHLSIIAIPITGEDHQIEGAISMATDITETVLAKLKFAQLNRELEEKVADKTRELKESLKIKTHFISDASHELRTPLTIAKLNLEFFRKKFAGGKDKEYEDILNCIDAEINKAADILSDMAFFIKIDENPNEIILPSRFDACSLLQDLTKRTKLMADEKKIKILFIKKNAPLIIEGDKLRLEKLFLNLIGNSIKYGRKKGWIKISVSLDETKKNIKIRISDNGVGIDKKDLPHIFDRFYRADSSLKTGSGGLGLGLSVAKWITEQHKGHIGAESILGRGTAFTITLPIKQQKAV